MHVLLRGNPTLNAIVASVVTAALLLVSFSLFEPVVTYGQETFTVNQEITSQISFLTPPDSVAMSGSIQGVTGGRAYGTTTFNISTNDPDGYTVNIVFSTSTAMVATSSTSTIPNYNPSAGGALADQYFIVTAGTAAFGYTVQNETTPDDVDATFKNTGATCGSGSQNIGECWYNKDDATSAEQIINASGPTVGTGATSSIQFQVAVGSNPNPALRTGWYVATATLTAAVK